MSNRWLEVRESDGEVVNAIVWDGDAPYEPDGIDFVNCDDAPGVWIGWRRTATGWEPPQEEPQQSAPDPVAGLAALLVGSGVATVDTVAQITGQTPEQVQARLDALP